MKERVRNFAIDIPPSTINVGSLNIPPSTVACRGNGIDIEIESMGVTHQLNERNRTMQKFVSTAETFDNRR